MKIISLLLVSFAIMTSGCMTTAPYNKADISSSSKIAYASRVENEFRIQKVGTTAFNNDFHSFDYSGDINEIITGSINSYLKAQGVDQRNVQSDSVMLKSNFELNVWTRSVKGLDSYLDDLAVNGIDLLILVLDRQGMNDPIGHTSIPLSGFGHYQRTLFGTEKNYIYFLPVFHFIDTKEKKVHFSRIADLYSRTESMKDSEDSIEIYTSKNKIKMESELSAFIDTATQGLLRKEGL